ncbi:hypothetical protein V2J09_007971 [Rumex salicifolius]
MVEFGRSYVIKPKGSHEATIVWLHDLGDRGSTWSQILENLDLPNVKWICPTAPTRPVTLFGGYPSTAWFDSGDLSEDYLSDFIDLDASASYIASLLSAEPPNVKLAIGGFSMGAATALYSAIRHVLGQYANGDLYTVQLSAIIGLSGWLPSSSTVKTWIESSNEAQARAASLPILLCHGSADEVVGIEQGEKSAQILTSAGFHNVTFNSYEELGHYTVPEETNDICNWLTETLGLDGAASEP